MAVAFTGVFSELIGIDMELSRPIEWGGDAYDSLATPLRRESDVPIGEGAIISRRALMILFVSSPRLRATPRILTQTNFLPKSYAPPFGGGIKEALFSPGVADNAAPNMRFPHGRVWRVVGLRRELYFRRWAIRRRCRFVSFISDLYKKSPQTSYRGTLKTC